MPPSSPPRVTVVVANHNRRDLLRLCLRSLEEQAGVSAEVIVVDNGSADGSVEMLAAEFPAARVIRNAANEGFCRANNQGIAAARGAFVALLNNDAEAAPGWLSALLAAFDGRPTLGMAASKILVHEDPRRIDKAGHLIYPDGQNRGRGSGEIDRGQYDQLEEVLWPDGCAAMYRRAMLDEIGGFDEDLFAYADDAELGLRARIAGWSCLYVPTAVVRHRRGQTLGLFSRRRLELIERNRVLLAAKHFPPSLLWRTVPYYLLRLAAGAWAGLRGRGEAGRFAGADGKLLIATALLRGDWEAVRMLPRTWRKRRELARIRRLSTVELRALLERHRISLRELSEGAV